MLEGCVWHLRAGNLLSVPCRQDGNGSLPAPEAPLALLHRNRLLCLPASVAHHLLHWASLTYTCMPACKAGMGQQIRQVALAAATRTSHLSSSPKPAIKPWLCRRRQSSLRASMSWKTSLRTWRIWLKPLGRMLHLMRRMKMMMQTRTRSRLAVGAKHPCQVLKLLIISMVLHALVWKHSNPL